MFQEHFGLNETQVIDPLNDENIQAMNQIANVFLLLIRITQKYTEKYLDVIPIIKWKLWMT